MSWYAPKRVSKSASDGIRLQVSSNSAHSGWGQRWMESVAHFTSPKLLERGLRYAKSGQVLSLHVEQGFAAAEVQGSRTRPYKVEIGLPMFTHKQWMRVADSLLKKAFYTAKLLAGDLPREIEPIFLGAGASLVPVSQDDISSDCACADFDNPCKHVTAVYYILGQEIERDPFLLMEMRGLSRAQLLAEIQTRRSKKDEPVTSQPATAPLFDRPAQTALSHRLNDFFQTPQDHSLNWPVEPDTSEQRLKAGGRIHEMGAPPFWQSDNEFEDVLTRIYQAVRKRVLE